MQDIRRKITPFLLVSMLLPGLCFASEPDTKMLTHVVIAWLKPEFRTEQFISELMQANQLLKQIPQVQSLEYGSALESQRNIVDDSFDLGIMMTFKSEQDMKDYLVHPVHVEYLDKYIKGKVEKVVVYDF